MIDPKLAEAMVAAASELTHVEKSGRNHEQKYDYATDADVSHEVRKACLKHGIIPSLATTQLVSSVEIVSKHGSKGERVTVAVTVRFLHTSGASLDVCSMGSGFDYGDKAVPKAITNGVKYALLKGLCLPTGDDPEGDPETDRHPAQQVRQDRRPQVDPAATPEHHKLAKMLKDWAIPWTTVQTWCAEEFQGFVPARLTEMSQEHIKGIAARMLRESEEANI